MVNATDLPKCLSINWANANAAMEKWYFTPLTAMLLCRKEVISVKTTPSWQFEHLTWHLEIFYWLYTGNYKQQLYTLAYCICYI